MDALAVLAFVVVHTQRPRASAAASTVAVRCTPPCAALLPDGLAAVHFWPVSATSLLCGVCLPKSPVLACCSSRICSARAVTSLALSAGGAWTVQRYACGHVSPPLRLRQLRLRASTRRLPWSSDVRAVPRRASPDLSTCSADASGPSGRTTSRAVRPAPDGTGGRRRRLSTSPCHRYDASRSTAQHSSPRQL